MNSGLQCLSVDDRGSCWLVRCCCGAGWLAAKDNPNPSAIIAHALSHQKPLEGRDELLRQIGAVKAALADGAADDAAALFGFWLRALRSELQQTA